MSQLFIVWMRIPNGLRSLERFAHASSCIGGLLSGFPFENTRITCERLWSNCTITIDKVRIFRGRREWWKMSNNPLLAKPVVVVKCSFCVTLHVTRKTIDTRQEPTSTVMILFPSKSILTHLVRMMNENKDQLEGPSVVTQRT